MEDTTDLFLFFVRRLQTEGLSSGFIFFFFFFVPLESGMKNKDQKANLAIFVIGQLARW